MRTNYRIPVPAVGFQPPVYVCRYNDKPFTLDGNLDKDFWRDIPFTEDFADIEGDIRPVPRFRTRAKLAWDRENLYIGALLEGDEIWATLTEHDCVIFHDNDFEIFIDPDSDTQAYYEYEMNALNTTWDLLLTKAYRDGGKPVNGYEFHGMRSAVRIDGELNRPGAGNRAWSVEVVMPFAALQECAARNRPPAAGEYYRMNFSRVQWKVDVAEGAFRKRLSEETGKPLPEDNWVWAPTGIINIHYPELWAFVFFAEGEEEARECRIPEDEYRKWELRKLYYAQQACLDENGCYTDRLRVLQELLERISPCEANGTLRDLPYRVSVTPHFFEITCPAADGKGVLAIFADGRTCHYAEEACGD